MWQKGKKIKQVFHETGLQAEMNLCTWIFKVNFDLVVLQLDIVQRQYIHQAGLKQTDLVKVAFSARGEWLATVEEREEETDPELQLKLWFYDEETQR